MLACLLQAMALFEVKGFKQIHRLHNVKNVRLCISLTNFPADATSGMPCLHFGMV